MYACRYGEEDRLLQLEGGKKRFKFLAACLAHLEVPVYVGHGGGNIFAGQRQLREEIHLIVT
ncbi:MAG: hypothetical protein MUQ10_03225, partial [Anaerolineae bacterium]|nr:hypothetical protein [Anaerolineae bacterium]